MSNQDDSSPLAFQAGCQRVPTRKRKRNRECHETEIPLVPPSLLIEQVFPFLDRTSWNRLAMSCKEIYKASQTLIPPWPTGYFQVGSSVYCVAFSPNDNLSLAFGGSHGLLHIWKRREGHVKALEGHGNAGVNSVAYSPDGRLLASAGDRTVVLWNLNDMSCRHVLKHPRAFMGQKVHSAVFSPDGKSIATGSEDGRLRLWKVEDGSIIRIMRVSGAVMAISFSPDGHYVAFGGADHTIRIKNLVEGSRICLEDTSCVNTISFSPDGRYIASGCRSQTGIRLWGMEEQSYPRLLNGHSSSVTSLTFCGEAIFSGSEDSTVRSWDVKEGACISFIRSHARCILSVAVASDQRTMAAGNITGNLCLWRL